MVIAKPPEIIGNYPRRPLTVDEVFAEIDKAAKPPEAKPDRRDAALPRPTEGEAEAE